MASVTASIQPAGPARQIVDASGTSHLTYDHANRLTRVTNIDGLLAGVAVTNHFQAPNGRDSLAVLGLGTALQHNYSYDSYGRLYTVSAGTCSAAYGYLPNSDLLRTTTCSNGGTNILTTTRSWEYGLRLAAIVNQANGAVVSSHAYLYDALNRRRQASLEDGSIWKYDYNNRDELTGARRYWPDWSPVSGQHFAYDYDSIGNRKTASAGGDVNGAGPRQTTYTANALNQYTGITTPGYKDICGAAIATNSVIVNGDAADRKIEYFHREISIANSGGPLWQDVTVASGGVTNKGGFVFPANNQTLTNDADGNLTFDGIWTYEWDGENRLIIMTMTNVAGIAPTNRLRLEFAYDFQGRRVQKKVLHWNSGDWILDSDSRFIYDGWNLIAILNSSFNLQTSFLWGQDLSGTMSGAGGIGGLILLTTHASPSTNCFVSDDGIGNITAVFDAAVGAVLARYEYSPFGEPIRATGPVGRLNPFRYSTKFADDESGLLYYGRRYCCPIQGRWLGRDPSQEKGGRNLFTFVFNCPAKYFDSLGDAVPVLSGQEFELAVQQGIDLALLFPSLPGQPNPAVCALMVCWFGPGGKYDFDYLGSNGKHNPLRGELFNTPGMGTLHSDQFANFLAGYAGGYASFKSGNIFYATAVLGVGMGYDLLGQFFDKAYKQSDGFSMRWNGMMMGIMDALDDSLGN